MARLPDPLIRLIACAVVAAGYFIYSNAILPIPITPVRPPADVGIAVLRPFSQAMTRPDRLSLSQAYAILASGVTADAPAEPVFARVSQIRQGHRAALLMVWSAMGNQADKYPGLGPALEQLLSSSLGDEDVLVTPDIRRTAGELFQSISTSFK